MMISELFFKQMAEDAFDDCIQNAREYKALNDGIANLCKILVEKGFEFNATTSKCTSDLLDAKKDIVAVLVKLAELSLEKAYVGFLYEHKIPDNEAPVFSIREKIFEDYIKNFVIMCKIKMQNEITYGKLNFYLQSVSEEYQNMEMNLPDKHSEYLRNTLSPISLYLVSESCNEVGYKLPIVKEHLGNQRWEKDGLEDTRVINDVDIRGVDVKMEGFKLKGIEAGGNSKTRVSGAPKDTEIENIQAGQDVDIDIEFENSSEKSVTNKKFKMWQIITAIVAFLAGLSGIITLVLQFI